MAHVAENVKQLKLTSYVPRKLGDLTTYLEGFADVCILRLPAAKSGQYNYRLDKIEKLINEVANQLTGSATLITIGEVVDLVAVHAAIPTELRYQSWIALRRDDSIKNGGTSLPRQHFGALIHTRYKESLRHTKTRLAYTYCPVCDKTTKDYGGKKHTYHHYGTLLSDVWRDLDCALEGNLEPVFDRFADFFGLEPYSELRIIDCRKLLLTRSALKPIRASRAVKHNQAVSSNRLLNGDCLTELRKLPDNSVDFAFADPPYNLRKKYTGYSDDLEITEYFDWCDEWISELARVLKPGRTCAILNIPLYAIRHFLYMETKLDFENWIVWDALSYPVRLLMPAHYSILSFSKGNPRVLTTSPDANPFLSPLKDDYCVRGSCIEQRARRGINDRESISDIWSDLHRLKHNTRRVDHPCQLPPSLMYRLISLYTRRGETVLDCFNGAGTTTLTAAQLGRQYIGIEREKSYHELTKARHGELKQGLDPFRKAERVLTAKNSPVPRMPKQKYEVPKKTLQLEVRRVAMEIGHVPSRDELREHGKFPIEYYDKYFASWGEACAAARTTGMSENRLPHVERQMTFSDLLAASAEMLKT